eukprot:gene6292-biopygen221
MHAICTAPRPPDPLAARLAALAASGGPVGSGGPLGGPWRPALAVRGGSGGLRPQCPSPASLPCTLPQPSLSRHQSLKVSYSFPVGNSRAYNFWIP